VDGHEVTVVEVMEDEGPSFLLVADEVVVNSDAPLPVAPTEADVRDVYRRWRAGLRAEGGEF
jgi:hypothetical protein